MFPDKLRELLSFPENELAIGRKLLFAKSLSEFSLTDRSLLFTCGDLRQ